MISNPKGLPPKFMKEFLGLSQGSRMIIFDVLSLHREYKEKELLQKLEKAKSIKKDIKNPKQNFNQKKKAITSQKKNLKL